MEDREQTAIAVVKEGSAHDSSEDDDLTDELVREGTAAARTAFDTQDYEAAASFLREALAIIEVLPKQSTSDDWDITFMLAVCAYHLESLAEAEHKLLQVIDASSGSHDLSSERQRHVYEAGHLLSQLYAKVGNLDAAQLYCDQALQGRRRLLGKTSHETWESVALTARLFQLQGNESRAKIYRRLIHDERKRDELQKVFAQLERSDEAAEQYRLARLQRGPADESSDRISRSHDASTESLISSSLEATVSRDSGRPTQPHLQQAPAVEQLSVEELNAGDMRAVSSTFKNPIVTIRPTNTIRPQRTLSLLDDSFSTFPEVVTTVTETEKHLSFRSDEGDKLLNLRSSEREKQLVEPAKIEKRHSSQSIESETVGSLSPSHSECSLTIRTSEGDIKLSMFRRSNGTVSPLSNDDSMHRSSRTSLTLHVSVKERDPWRYYSQQIRSGKYNDALVKAAPKEGGQLILKFEGNGDHSLKLSVNPTNMEFVFGRQDWKVLPVPGRLVAGQNVIERITTNNKKEWNGTSFREKRIIVRKWEVRDDTEVAGTRNTLVLDPRLHYEP